ncbi:MAG TPA: type II toxin-antitoxin system prevent-host-death family antitoxin [Geminicoccaceae bacterium]|nr:type II toxin-antitoxin system prevent-host-death family antitoxin [Geminicoccaceae bacterium]
MIAISARDANQQFARILQLAAQGQEVTITRHGRPVAKLVPVADAADPSARQRQEVIEWLRGGPIAGEAPRWTRDELYERDEG